MSKNIFIKRKNLNTPDPRLADPSTKLFVSDGAGIRELLLSECRQNSIHTTGSETVEELIRLVRGW